MARRIAHAEWTGELANGRGEVSIGGEHLGLAYTPAWLQGGAGTNPEELLDVEPVGVGAGADSSPTELRPTPPRAERWGAGRERRALEGRVMSGIRAQSRRRHSTGAGRSPALANPRPSGSADH